MAQAQNRLVFVDETGTSTKMTRARGRSPKGGGLIAKAYDSRAIEDILHGNETRVWGDSAYQGQREAIRTAAPQTQDFTHHRGNRALALSDEEMAKNRTKSRVRAHVEHPFRILKCVFGFRKVCYRGIAKNLTRLQVSFALVNLYTKQRQLLRSAAA